MKKSVVHVEVHEHDGMHIFYVAVRQENAPCSHLIYGTGAVVGCLSILIIILADRFSSCAVNIPEARDVLFTGSCTIQCYICYTVLSSEAMTRPFQFNETLLFSEGACYCNEFSVTNITAVGNARC